MDTDVNTLKKTLEDAIKADQPEAIVQIATALVQAKDEGDPPGIYQYHIGIALLKQGKVIDAIQWLQDAGQRLPQGDVRRAKAWTNVAHLGATYGLGASLKEGAQRVLDEYVGQKGEEFERCLGVAHQALGQYHAWLGQHQDSADHHGMAVSLYTDPWRKLKAVCDQAYELALAQDLLQAQELLDTTDRTVMNHYPTGHFAHQATQAVVLHLSGSDAECLQMGETLLEANQTQDPTKKASLLTWMCRSALRLNKTSVARAYLRKARAIMTTADSSVMDEITLLEQSLEGVG